MKRWNALALLLTFAAGLAFRVPQLGKRPLHNDEAVNAVKVSDLWQHGRYIYDPDEYHGPSLHYASIPFLRLSGARGPADFDDGRLRLVTVGFGVGLILLLLLFVDGLGWHAILWAGLFTAISPAMVFYSRYFIHEMLLVFFSALAIGAGWRYTRSPSGGWALLAGAALGLMFATKETFVLSVLAMGVALTVIEWWSRVRQASPEFHAIGARTATPPLRNGRHIALALSATLFVWLLFFSSFFTHFAGLADSVRTYLPWLKRAGGHSPHLHPWYFYIQRLAWFHPVKGPVWSEGLILVLALVGAILSFTRKGSTLLRFVSLYTLLLAALYSAISYKTPWCLLNFYYGMIFLAGFGAAAVVEMAGPRLMRAAVLVLVLGLSAQLAAQSWRASFVYSTDRRNPYVYAQTVPDILPLVERVKRLARFNPGISESTVKVIAPQSDYWPLPWYLRQLKNVGWYEKLPDEPLAPIMIVSSKLDARLDDKSDRKWIMAGISQLRPGAFFELYVELELWKKFVESLPPDQTE